MKPLPSQSSKLQPPPVPRNVSSQMPSLPDALSTPVPSYSTANRRASSCTTQRAYPWLLVASTVIAAAFCLMYITKPVILASQEGRPAGMETPQIAKMVAGAVKTSIMPDQNRLPGEALQQSQPAVHAGNPLSASSSAAAFEQTNIRIQHILTAEAPGGHLAKIDLDVPVLYQSRNLRWTPSEVADARGLLARLTDYQEKSRTLRLEGIELLASWNQLVERSIPSADLRADSPTLPTNQQDTAEYPRPVGLDTTESIQIKAAGK